jgi:hypothetical protein
MRTLKVITLLALLLPVTGCKRMTALLNGGRGYSEMRICQFNGDGSPSTSLVVLSPNKRRIAYIAKTGDNEAVFADGKQGRPYSKLGDLAFSPDSLHVTYEAKVGDKWIAVVDGQEQGSSEAPGQPQAPSPQNGQKFDVVRSGEKWSVLLNGKMGKGYEAIVDAIQSPNGQRVAYAVKSGPKYIVVVDGSEEKSYDAIGYRSLAFSPDSGRVFYMAYSGDKAFVVVDGIEGKPYDDLGGGGPIHSSDDGGGSCYARELSQKWIGSVNSKVPNPMRCPSKAIVPFSPDSRKVAYVAKSGNKYSLVVDGKEGKQYDDIVGGAFVFDSPNTLHYLAANGNSSAFGYDIFVVEEEIF